MALEIKKRIKQIRMASDIIRHSCSAKKPRVTYAGHWMGYQNLGDEALFDAVKLLFPQFGFIVFPHWGGKEITIPAKVLRLFNFGMVAGGTIIKPSEYLLKQTQNCMEVCKKHFVFGTGVAQPCFSEDRSDWRSILSQWVELLAHSEYIGVRGPISARILTEAGLKNVEVVGDPVLVFADKSLPDESAYKPSVLGLNIASIRGGLWGSMARVAKQFESLASIAKKERWTIKWFVLSPEDVKITEDIAKRTGTDEQICNVYQDYKAYMDQVRSVSVFVGIRLHAVALATCAYVPSVMLEYRPKC
ncbi:MAG: polysaccharide pyruvyl transferase family protein, partial [Anaerohalosphaera sp.]|nr:polysaccharide pyruvyl transferase family protein [Anaerohalosphaera sp.]